MGAWDASQLSYECIVESKEYPETARYEVLDNVAPCVLHTGASRLTWGLVKQRNGGCQGLASPVLLQLSALCRAATVYAQMGPSIAPARAMAAT